MDQGEKNSPDYFNICVSVIEAKDLPSANISSFVRIQVGEEKKSTKVIRNTNQPYFNEYFVFEIYSNFDNFMDTIITLSIFQPRRFGFKKLIGCITFDTGIVWSQPNERLQTWLPVTLPSDCSGQVKGLLKCNIRIATGSTYHKKHSEIEDLGIKEYFVGRRIRFRIKVYKCVGLKSGTKEIAPDVLVRVLFAGKEGSTTVRKLRETVEWNEQVTFIATFPPRFHKLTVELVVGKSTISKHFYILESLKFLSGGYQFGPNYVHLYKNEFSYCGSLFMAIETDTRGEFNPEEKLHKITILPIEKPTKQIFGDIENFLCFGILFDAMLNGRKWKGSDVYLTLDFGYFEHDAKDEAKNRPSTDKLKPIPGNAEFCYLPLNERKPCVFVRSEWPDRTFRLQNSNMLSNLARILSQAIDLAEELIVKGDTLQAKYVIKSSLLEFKKECQYMSKKLVQGANGHDIGRVKFLSKVLNFKLPNSASLCIAESNIEVILKKSTSLLNAVNKLSEDVQESLPFIILSLKSKQTVIGSCKINPRNILFSKKPKIRGCDCGKVMSVIIKSGSNNATGRIDVWLWLGFWDEVAYCLKETPSGHEDLTKIVSLPTFLTYANFQRYIVYCRIYSGYLLDSPSLEGPCDTFVRVLCLNQSQQTKPVKKAIAPIWNETTLLTDIRFYRPINQENPPVLSVELWNQTTNPPKLMGVELVKPSYDDHKTDKEHALQWLTIENKAKILSAFVILRVDSDPGKSFDISALSTTDVKFVDPVTLSFRLEVVFWGIRAVDTSGLDKKIARVQAIIQCSTSELKSDIITQTLKSLNFKHDLHTLPVQLPSVQFFSPPLVLQIISDNIYIGCNIEKNVHRYSYKMPTKTEWETLYTQRKSQIEIAEARHASFHEMPDLIPLMDVDARNRSYSDDGSISKGGFLQWLGNILDRFKLYFLRSKYEEDPAPMDIQDVIEEKDRDWWYGYFSGEVKLYKEELENQIEFSGFNDVLATFLIKERKEGKLKDVMKVKTLMCLYEWPSQKTIVTYQGQDPETGVIQVTELRDRVKLLVRVYCIRAHNLDPSDPNGLADPYIEIATPSNCINDKGNYIPKQLNPIFGKCFEISATLPIDSCLIVRILDWDLFSADDLIGETVIDIENRFYSKHRATCGLPKLYSKTGYNTWRDVEKPSEILEKLCNSYNLPLPRYFERSVLIGSKEFVNPNPPKSKEERKERLALVALNKWSEMPIVGRCLVPHHVETRSLYQRDKPGIERGKLELWVDLFDQTLGEIPPPVDIQPSEPEAYELRVVILNTAKVPLVDDSLFVGKKSTDIFVKGWLWDADEAQTTDIHYTSINGNGAFNWRFVFPFFYLKQEKRMVVYHKDRFSLSATENRIPPMLHLQVWDSDRITPDDFIGAMVLELCNMPRGSISVRTCKPSKYTNPTQTFDLFKVKRMKGWWPFFQMTTDMESQDAGFLEAEFHLLTKEEALLNPAGLGRAPPNALPPPYRPSIRIKFWLAPCRAILYYVCMAHKGKILACVSLMGIVLFALVGIYSLPFFIMKRLTGA